MEAQEETVQELPQEYVYKGSDAETLGASLPMIVDLPTIDFNLLMNSSPSSTHELEKLSTALSSWGCFSAINHGIEASFLDKVRDDGEQFFALPLEKKKKHAREINGFEGYSNHNHIVYQDKSFDWIDRLYLIARPKDRRNVNFWPEIPDSFMETLDDYIAKLEKLNEILLKASAMALNLEQNCFLDMYGEEATLSVAYNLYPPCPRPDLAVGISAHSDGTTFTYLLQHKEVEGLQILKDDRWYRVQIVPESIFINVGDQLEIMSNGIFKSVVHRVVTNPERERMSLAVFCFPNPNLEIGPVNGVVTEARPRLYKTVKDYMTTLFEHIVKGGRAIEAAKV